MNGHAGMPHDVGQFIGTVSYDQLTTKGFYAGNALKKQNPTGLSCEG